MGLAVTPPAAVEPATLQARSHQHFTPAKLEAFVVVAEEGGFSAAGRKGAAAPDGDVVAAH
jgi:hypothetical protein